VTTSAELTLDGIASADVTPELENLIQQSLAQSLGLSYDQVSIEEKVDNATVTPVSSRIRLMSGVNFTVFTVTIKCFASQLVASAPAGTNFLDVLNTRFTNITTSASGPSLFQQTLNSAALLQGLQIIITGVTVTIISQPPTASPTVGIQGSIRSRYDERQLYYLFILVGVFACAFCYRLCVRRADKQALSAKIVDNFTYAEEQPADSSNAEEEVDNIDLFMDPLAIKDIAIDIKPSS
jgi:hypothetical protein